jgi:hypothetical protein
VDSIPGAHFLILHYPLLGRVAWSPTITVSLYPNATRALYPPVSYPTAPLIPLYPKSPVGKAGGGKSLTCALGTSRRAATRP